MRFAILGFLLAALVTAPVAAHHSFARFDLTKTMTVDGVVARYEWANPHVYLWVTETNAAGEAAEWEIEGQPPALMRRMGWSRDTLTIGDAVRLTGAPARNASDKSVLMASLERAGSALYDRQSFRAAMSSGGMRDATVAAVSAAGLDGIWVTLLDAEATAGFAKPADRFQLTAAGAASVAAYDDATMNPGIDCISMPAPGSMIMPDTKRITVEDGVILISGEFDAGERVVHLRGDTTTAEPAVLEPSVQGHSVGRWEGKTLVIETTAFAPHAIGDGLGLTSGRAKRLVERLTLDGDGAGLAYEFELVDPEMLAAPVTGRGRWVYRPDLMFIPEACDPENARRFLQ